jgi:hypothetical protein
MVRVQNGSGQVFYIRVRSNKNFRAGLLVDLRSCHRIWRDKNEAGPGDGMQSGLPTYELMIPLPRFPGRWGWSALTNPHFGKREQYVRRQRESPRAV